MENLFWRVFLANCTITISTIIFTFMRMKQNKDGKEAGVGFLVGGLFFNCLLWLIWLKSVV